MRILILSAFFACAAAAPSGFIAPFAQIPYSAVAYPAIVPTISPGDIQAAEIDAKVKAQDYTRSAIDSLVQAEDIARAALDKAKELAEQATENNNEKSVTAADLSNEKSGEAFWSAEEKKWQAIDTLNTVQAEVDGLVARDSPILAKTAVGVPYLAAVASAPIIAPVSPIFYSGYVAPFNAIATQAVKSQEKSEATVKTAEVKTEEKSEQAEEKSVQAMEKSEQVVEKSEQTMEESEQVMEKSEQAMEKSEQGEEKSQQAMEKSEQAEEKSEQAEEKSEKIEAGEAVVKTADISVNNKPSVWTQSLIATGSIPNVYGYNLVAPRFVPYITQPLIKYAGVQNIHGVVAPTLVKTIW